MTLDKIEHLAQIIEDYLEGIPTQIGYALTEILGPDADTSQVWIAYAKLENEKLKINTAAYEKA